MKIFLKVFNSLGVNSLVLVETSFSPCVLSQVEKKEHRYDSSMQFDI